MADSMPDPSKAKTITDLADIIGKQTAIIEKYHLDNGLPSPSLSTGAGLFPPRQYPADVATAREILIDATNELQARAYGPAPLLFRQLTNRHNEVVSLHAVCKFNIGGVIPVGEELSYGDIAKKCGLNEDDVRRILRHAIGNYIFESPRPGFVTHNGPSQVLAESPGLRAATVHTMEDMVPSMSHLAFAIEKYPGSQNPKETGFSIAHQTDKPFFEFLSKSPNKSRNFGQAMKLFSSRPGFETTHIVSGFDWAGLGPNAVVVDIGGSNGHTSKVLIDSFSNITCIVQDLPEGLGSENLSVNGEIGRLNFMEYDFFNEQPVKNASVYLLRWILHDWSDGYCLKILRNLVPALGRKSIVVINDICVPDLVPQANSAFRDVTAMDMVMKASFNGRERNEEEWTALVKEADSRFGIRSFTQPHGSRLSLIVCHLDFAEGEPDAGFNCNG